MTEPKDPTRLALTEPQRRALATLIYLYDAHSRPVAPRQFAKAMWPDSPAWDQRTSRKGQTNGAVGGTMPMNGAKMLWRLKGMGLASIDWATYLWSPTSFGREVARHG